MHMMKCHSPRLAVMERTSHRQREVSNMFDQSLLEKSYVTVIAGVSCVMQQVPSENHCHGVCLCDAAGSIRKPLSWCVSV